jgi:hypothetical protein
MATRGDIRDAFTQELRAVSGTYDVTDSAGTVIDTTTLDEGNIGLRNPEQTESLPAVVYHDDYRKVVHNGAGTAPNRVVRNQDGSVDHEEHYEYVEAQFIVDVRASNEVAKEPIYEALRAQFARYQFGPWPATDLDDDVDDITVVDASTSDTGDTEDVIRGDQLEIRIEFHRVFEREEDVIDTVVQRTDTDDDSDYEQTFTTS